LLSSGSRGQPTINPLISLTLKLEEKILKLEQELGLTPLSRQRLGISVSENAMGFKQLQQLLQDDEEKELVDPRLLVLEEE
jgi:P27 family predicted phage terminase small subunit